MAMVKLPLLQSVASRNKAMKKPTYTSPKSEIIVIPYRGMLCGSPDTENTEQPGGNDDPDIPWS